MDLVVGAVCEGKVSGIMKFGAFVTLPGGKSGLVHISEIAHAYVTEVKDHLAEGQDVKVKVISIDETGRINLSIKKAANPPPSAARSPGRSGQPRQSARDSSAFGRDGYSASKTPGSPSFEDKLKQFMQDSDSKMSGNKHFSDKRGSSARRGKGR